ncbi:MAG: hypothetical protein ACOCQR_03525 [bacterium]
MKKYLIIIIFLLVFSFAVFSQENSFAEGVFYLNQPLWNDGLNGCLSFGGFEHGEDLELLFNFTQFGNGGYSRPIKALTPAEATQRIYLRTIHRLGEGKFVDYLEFVLKSWDIDSIIIEYRIVREKLQK